MLKAKIKGTKEEPKINCIAELQKIVIDINKRYCTGAQSVNTVNYLGKRN